MILKQICDVTNNQLIIKLPIQFNNKKKVVVYIEDFNELKEDKILLMKKASQDKFFLSDIKAINNDFKFIDFDGL